MKKIKIYVSNSCSYCHKIKDFMKEEGYDFEERNITTDSTARDELIRMNMRGVPVTIVGDETIVGFDTEKIIKAIKA